MVADLIILPTFFDSAMICALRKSWPMNLWGNVDSEAIPVEETDQLDGLPERRELFGIEL